RFAQVFNSSPAAILITRASDGRFVDVNPSYEQLFGYQRDELIGQTATALGIYTGTDQRAEIVRLLGERGTLRNLELVLRAKSGELRTTLCSLEAIERDGETCLLGSMVDITARTQAEEALRRSNQRLQVLADASHAFAEASANYQELLDQIVRIVAEQLQAVCIVRLISHDREWLETAALYHADPIAEEAARVLLERVRIHAENTNPFLEVVRSAKPLFLPAINWEAVRASLSAELSSALERSRPHSTIGVPLRIHGDVIGILGLTRFGSEQSPFDDQDLSLAQDLADRAALAIASARLLMQLQHELAERIRAEAEVRTLNDELEQRVAERTAELTTANQDLEAFSYSVSHDLRAPLRAIEGFSRILQEDFSAELPEEAQHHLQIVRDNTV
ncbi:MAG TPA: PAS domain S-box protein, partial [Roseiflexaceae bacterium]|nr:PAS domain S-box protein [Roseiflexaceae bacterium]